MAGRDEWLILALLLTVGAIVITFLAVSFDLSQEREKEVARLQTIADLKGRQLELWMRDRHEDAQYLGSNPYLLGSLASWRQREDKAARAQLMESLENTRRIYNYEGVYFYDGVQQSLQSLQKESVIEPNLQTALRQAIDSGAVTHIGPYLDKNGHIYLDFIAPLREGKQQTGDAIVLRTDLATFLFPMLRAWPSPSPSGENVLVRREGDQIIFLNDVRHRPGVATRLRASILERRLLAAQVLRGEARPGDVIEGVDYRGVPVLGVVRKINGTDWFLVSKLDLSEVNDAGYRSAFWIVLLGFFALLLIGSAAIALRQRQELRDALLERTTQKLSSQYARSLIEASLDPLVTISPDGKITDVNEATVKATGVSRQRLIGTDFSNYFTEPEKARAGYQEVYAKGFVTDYPLAICHASGDVTDVVYNASLYHDDNGQVSGVFAAARDVTERKRIEEQVREASLYTRSLIEASLDPLVTISPEGKITDVNEATVRVTGVAREALVGSDFSNYFTEPEKARAGYQEVYAKGFVTDYPLTLRHVSGKLTEVIYNASVYRNEKGEVSGVFAAARDITERKKLEADVIASAKEFQILAESMPQIVWITRSDGWNIYFNQQWVDYTGLTLEESYGHGWNKPFHPDDQQRAWDGWQNAVNNNGIYSLECRIRRADGAYRWWLVRGVPALDEDGKIYKWFGTCTDIEEIKLAEKALRAASQYSRSLIEASLDPLVTISPEGKITDVNEATVRVTGMAREALVGSDFSNYFTEPEKARAGYQEVYAKGFVTDYPLAIRHVSGDVTDVLYNASVYPNEIGEVAGVFAAARDVTELKRKEEELGKYRRHLEDLVTLRTADLAKTNEKLESANDELEAFAYSVSHDLRVPLRAIDGFSRILLEDYSDKLDAEGQRVLNVVRDSTVKIARLIDDILSFSRAGRVEMHLARIDMDELVHAVIEELAPVLPGRKLKFEVEPLASAESDSAMIRRVWTNLIDNAVKYTALKPEAVVEIGSTSSEREITYYVKDNGAGFDMQYVNKLFGVFQRLHGDEFAGTGIGLAIVKRVITRHHGRVWAEGKVNEGATFYFTLPIQEKGHA